MCVIIADNREFANYEHKRKHKYKRKICFKNESYCADLEQKFYVCV